MRTTRIPVKIAVVQERDSQSSSPATTSVIMAVQLEKVYLACHERPQGAGRRVHHAAPTVHRGIPVVACRERGITPTIGTPCMRPYTQSVLLVEMAPHGSTELTSRRSDGEAQ